MSEKYYVVEYRFPIQINEAKSPADAATKAAKICEDQFGFRPSHWFARVFEYDEDTVGPVGEWFSSPGGGKFRKIDKNIKDSNNEGHSVSRPERNQE